MVHKTKSNLFLYFVFTMLPNMFPVLRRNKEMSCFSSGCSGWRTPVSSKCFPKPYETLEDQKTHAQKKHVFEHNLRVKQRVIRLKKLIELYDITYSCRNKLQPPEAFWDKIQPGSSSIDLSYFTWYDIKITTLLTQRNFAS